MESVMSYNASIDMLTHSSDVTKNLELYKGESKSVGLYGSLKCLCLRNFSTWSGE